MRFGISALCAFLLAAGTASAQTADPASGQSALVEPAAPVVLSQNDARWKDLRLGNGTIGSQGCLVMSLAMILMEQGLIYDPRDLVTIFSRNGVVDGRGRVRTALLPFLFPALTILDRRPVRAGDTERIGTWIARGAFVLLKLDPAGRSRQHWVRASAVENGDVVVVDPAGGRVGLLRELYGARRVQEVVVLGTG